MKTQDIRNFCIIAHIDHGKSTLADRLLQITSAVDIREFHDQMLDDMEIERERGITIKASAVRINYVAKDGKKYQLNLIDTPGHVDFSYEVTKSLSACEGALLLIDAAQGIEAQTVANFYLANNQNMKILPVINKIDLPHAQPEAVTHQIQDVLCLDEPPILTSAKEGKGIEEILEAVVKKIPHPAGSVTNPLQALIFDSVFDNYKGVVVYVRVVNGCITPRMNISFMSNGKRYEVLETGILTPRPKKVTQLSAGEVGYICCNIKDPAEVMIGDTVTDFKNPAAKPLPGFKRKLPLVFCGLYPVNSKDFDHLRDALQKLKLTDFGFVFEQESSSSLGFGFRCGFLGLLHMDIVQERLEREFNVNLIATTPSVVYRVKKTNKETVEVDNPAKFPEPQFIEHIEEPYIKSFMIVPHDSLGVVMSLAQARRGIHIGKEFLDEQRMMLTYEFPLAEVIVDFYDKLKSLTKGYGSFDYEFIEYRMTKLVKLDILINGTPCDALSFLVHKDNAQYKGRQLVTKLREVIPRQLYEIAIQAAIGSRVIARETIKPMGKNVTAKCYGGDISRKRKLLEKQKLGRKRMKQFGKVQIPQEAFLAVLKIE
ncbi:MAG: translation elongation factor 4 [Candidatus Omnitrophica bacterium]|nr:translation elongation factor 4 [Candidatus Omnitrophota bacterium]MBU4478150.1 translation elongation factor 4 [Candidatus Omnitrophota bacterium]MCG2704053.1 translation elongation factor 4 [Candidatus Omnitrophota bacterium]